MMGQVVIVTELKNMILKFKIAMEIMSIILYTEKIRDKLEEVF